MRKIQLFLSAPHPCGYLPERSAVTSFIDPGIPVDTGLYSRLMAAGFRRSGGHIYRPDCPACNACVPVRIPVAAFTPHRSERRCLRRNADLAMSVVPPGFQAEHFDLYRRYQQYRHRGGDMALMDSQQYRDFLVAPWGGTEFYEFRADGRLLAVAVTDRLEDSLSAVYTFFAPEESSRSLGTYAILRQLAMARECGLRWLYLGYWIEASPKMRYKGRFRPLQAYRDGHWQHVEPRGAG